jgi:hypothetical protein
MGQPILPDVHPLRRAGRPTARKPTAVDTCTSKERRKAKKRHRKAKGR